LQAVPEVLRADGELQVRQRLRRDRRQRVHQGEGFAPRQHELSTPAVSSCVASRVQQAEGNMRTRLKVKTSRALEEAREAAAEQFLAIAEAIKEEAGIRVHSVCQTLSSRCWAGMRV